MSRDNPVPRCRTWNFSHTLYTSILPEATRGLHPTSTIDPFVLIKSLFEKLFKEGPAPVFYIHLRVSRAAFDLCVSCGKTGAALPDLPFAGFIQARYAVGLSILQPWLDTRWTPVGSKLLLLSILRSCSGYESDSVMLQLFLSFSISLTYVGLSFISFSVIKFPGQCKNNIQGTRQWHM